MGRPDQEQTKGDSERLPQDGTWRLGDTEQVTENSPFRVVRRPFHSGPNLELSLSPSTKTSLLAIPREIRDEILWNALKFKDCVAILPYVRSNGKEALPLGSLEKPLAKPHLFCPCDGNPFDHPMFWVCKSLRSEALESFYKTNHFLATSFMSLAMFIDKAKGEVRYLRFLTLRYHTSTDNDVGSNMKVLKIIAKACSRLAELKLMLSPSILEKDDGESLLQALEALGARSVTILWDPVAMVFTPFGRVTPGAHDLLKRQNLEERIIEKVIIR